MYSKEDIILLILAGGLGSRYGRLKQLDGVGPNNESLFEYALYDAIEIGLKKAVIVIHSEHEQAFYSIKKKWQDSIHLQFVFQDEEASPKRQKPWGTGQAVLSAMGVISGPFISMNADDFYGRSSLEQAVNHLVESEKEHTCALVGYSLQSTLSSSGGVNRGIIKTDESTNVASIEEHHEIRVKNGVISSQEAKAGLEVDNYVSMNLWAADSSLLSFLKDDFKKFASTHTADPRVEYYLPNAIMKWSKLKEIPIEFVKSSDSWFGMTYRNDKKEVQSKLEGFSSDGVYPNPLR